jgi:thiamine transport system ATP-binding protein
MRAGRIVQQGTPAEVWRRPVDAWTARFFGFGPATPCTARAGALETPWGRLPAPAGTPEGRVDLVFRPDALRLDVAGPLDGIVTGTTFTGALVTLMVEPVPGAALTVRVPQRDAPAVGDCVRMAVDRDGLLAYRQTES